MVPQILHVDMDAFFVSVEELADPSLRGKPVIVGADPDGRGVVAAASYAARKFGVHSAMPIRTAKKLCPHAIFLRGHHEKYREYSDKVYTIFQEFSPAIEMVSIDEAYLDLTGCERLLGGRVHIAPGVEDRFRSSQTSWPALRAAGLRKGIPCTVACAQNARDWKGDRTRTSFAGHFNHRGLAVVRR